MTDADFRDAFHRHKDVVYRFAYRMTGAEPVAEDIVQDCFAALWRKPEAFDSGRGSLRAFLLGIARNLVLKHWRSRRPQEELGEDTSICEPFDAAALERGEAVKKAVLLLPPLQREALILAEYEEDAARRHLESNRSGAGRREIAAAPGPGKPAAYARAPDAIERHTQCNQMTTFETTTLSCVSC